MRNEGDRDHRQAEAEVSLPARSLAPRDARFVECTGATVILPQRGRHVDKLDLSWPHFRLDPVQLPCPTLRAAVWANPHGLSVTPTGPPLQFEEQLLLEPLTRSAVASLPCQIARFFAGGARLAAARLDSVLDERARREEAQLERPKTPPSRALTPKRAEPKPTSGAKGPKFRRPSTTKRPMPVAVVCSPVFNATARRS